MGLWEFCQAERLGSGCLRSVHLFLGGRLADVDCRGESGRWERWSGPSPPAATVERGAEASDCGGDPRAGCVGADGRSTLHPVEHLRTFAGILQADAYAGYKRLYELGRSPGPVTEALCWAHGRRRFYELANIAAGKRRGKSAPPISPLALEAVKRIDALFDIEREVNGESAERRLVVRRERSAPLVAELEDWMRTERAGLSRHAAVAKAMDYMLKRWDGFTRFLDDGRICLTNNASERALRGICLGRKSWLFCGSDRGGERAAVMYTLIGTAKLNDVDPQAWLADVLARIAEQPQARLHELLPWHWKAERQQALAAQLRLLSFAGTPLHRRTGHRGVRAVHAAIPGFRLEDCSAMTAIVEPLTGVRRHRLGLGVAARRTGNGGLEK